MLKLPRLPIGWSKISGLFERYWDQTMSSIEKSLDIQTESGKSLSLLTSFVKSLVPVLTLNSTGLVTILPHTRVYGSGEEVAVAGGTINTSAVVGSIITVYYSDSSMAGGSVGYSFTTDPMPRPYQQKGVHVVGTGVIPNTGITTGTNLSPLGTIYI